MRTEDAALPGWELAAQREALTLVAFHLAGRLVFVCSVRFRFWRLRRVSGRCSFWLSLWWLRWECWRWLLLVLMRCRWRVRRIRCRARRLRAATAIRLRRCRGRTGRTWRV